MPSKRDDFIDKVRELEKDWVQSLVTHDDQGRRLFWFGRIDRSDNMVPLKFEASNAAVAWKKLIDHVEALKDLPPAS
uniref:Uncharacterized protein n=1 Tax=Pseudomonas phage Cygsa01 TaxID=3138529 RepID=A0AAU6W3J3_9VIRU